MEMNPGQKKFYKSLENDHNFQNVYQENKALNYHIEIQLRIYLFWNIYFSLIGQTKNK